jgi:hypothetical protein
MALIQFVLKFSDLLRSIGKRLLKARLLRLN